MPQYVDTNTKTFYAGGAIARYLRVKLTAGKLAAAGSTDVELGTIEEAALAENDLKAVRIRTAAGTALMVASGAITLGDPVYAAASGKIASSGTVLVGTALEAAGANNDIIEVLRRAETSDSAAAGGTTAAVFEVDSDLGKPRAALGSQAGGTGDFKAVIKPPATLTADRDFTLPADSAQTLVGATATQTLTNKTLTSPVIGTQATAAGSTFVPFVPLAAAQALSGAGAVNITTFCTKVTSTAADALTLANGAIIGQLKKIQLIVDGGDATLTPTSLVGGTTITFADAGDYALLGWNGTGWVPLELGNAADGATAPVLA